MAFKTRRNRSQTEARLQTLKGDFEALQRDMRLLLDSLGSDASRVGTDAGQRMMHATSDAATQVEGWANDGVETVRETIRAQPLAAIAISMSAGAVISSLLRR